MSALPGYFRPRPVRLWREHHPLQCRDSAPCSQSWYAPIAVERHVDCRFGDRSASPWFDVASACRKNLVQSDTCDPIGHQSRILPCFYASLRMTMTCEQEPPGLLSGCLDVVINRLSG